MRLIDADDIVYDSIDSEDTNRHAYYYGTGIMAVRKEDIDDAPTIDAVEVVRCKDCKWCDIEIPSRCIKDRCYCATVDSFMKPMDYCSYAERRTDE